ncbi:hypothetical protein IAS59_006628 [Cryptococcus gattii]
MASMEGIRVWSRVRVLGGGEEMRVARLDSRTTDDVTAICYSIQLRSTGTCVISIGPSTLSHASVMASF